MKLPETPMTAEEELGFKIGVVLMGVVAIALKIIVPTLLWRWFAVPLGAPHLGYAHVFGLLLLFGTIRRRYTGNAEETSPKKVAENVAMLLTTLALGLVCSYFV